MKDIILMREAIAEAKKAYKKNEVPIGAIIVNDKGEIISKAHNLVDGRKSQLAHAEIIAIEKASKKLGDWRLEGCSIYVTLEPCAMCMNLILLSRLEKLFFALESPVFGYRLDKNVPISVYRKNALQIFEGICKEEVLPLMKCFFKVRRGYGKEKIGRCKRQVTPKEENS